MFARTLLASCLVLFVGSISFAADVVVKDTDKNAKAKVGDIVDIQIPNPALPKMKEDVKADAPGKTLGKATITDEERKGPDGTPVPGGGYKSIKLKAETKGKVKVKVSGKQDGKESHKEYEVTVE